MNRKIYNYYLYLFNTVNIHNLFYTVKKVTHARNLFNTANNNNFFLMMIIKL